MSQFSCVIQAGSAAEHAKDELERRLSALHADHYAGEATSVSWLSVADGYMFTEGRQSSSSIIACALRHETSVDDRERYMRGVCDVWTDVTGCTDHEVVVAIVDAAPF